MPKITVKASDRPLRCSPPPADASTRTIAVETEDGTGKTETAAAEGITAAPSKQTVQSSPVGLVVVVSDAALPLLLSSRTAGAMHCDKDGALSVAVAVTTNDTVEAAADEVRCDSRIPAKALETQSPTERFRPRPWRTFWVCVAGAGELLSELDETEPPSNEVGTRRYRKHRDTAADVLNTCATSSHKHTSMRIES